MPPARAVPGDVTPVRGGQHGPAPRGPLPRPPRGDSTAPASGKDRDAPGEMSRGPAFRRADRRPGGAHVASVPGGWGRKSEHARTGWGAYFWGRSGQRMNVEVRDWT